MAETPKLLRLGLGRCAAEASRIIITITPCWRRTSKTTDASSCPISAAVSSGTTAIKGRAENWNLVQCMGINLSKCSFSALAGKASATNLRQRGRVSGCCLFSLFTSGTTTLDDELSNYDA
ncbi:hypothetical protein BaRGS_00008275 [Batillaria attramentaria]|uniref:Uncharacterized protein n=1 Tax=Batillaria attramentaria TaxID=370345 RepID=A0ABD0LME1_9CAEN